MERKTETQIKGLIKEERNAHFIFSDDLFLEADEIKGNEDYLAQKFLTIIGSNKEDEEEIMIKIRPDQLYNFFVRIQREILIGK